MDWQKTAEILTAEMAQVREQLDLTRAALDELLAAKSSDSPPGAQTVASGASQRPGGGHRRAHGVLTVPVPPAAPTLSRDQTGQAVGARLQGHTAVSQEVPGPAPGGTRPGVAGPANNGSQISLKGLAAAIEQAHTAKNGNNDGHAWNGAITMPLSDLARVLEHGPQSANPASEPRGRRVGAQPRATGGSPKIPFAGLARSHAGARAGLRHGSLPPRQETRPMPRRRSDPSPMPLPRPRSHMEAERKPETPGGPSGGVASPRSGHTTAERQTPSLADDDHARAARSHTGGTLDVNLLANLTRWVGAAKRQLGLRRMREVLDLYRLSGHLPPAMERAIFQLSQLGMMSDDSDYDPLGHDGMIDAMQRLHGIVYGSGRPPGAPSAEFDPAQWDLLEDEDDRGDRVLHEVTEAPASKHLPVAQSMRPADSPAQVLPGWEPDPVEAEPHEPQRARGEALSTFRSALQSVARLTRELEARASMSQRGVNGSPQRQSEESSAAGFKESAARDLSRLDDSETKQSGAAIGHERANGRDSLNGLTGHQWGVVETLIPPVKPGGRPSKYDRREILGGILHQSRSGCSWRNLPREYPPWKIVHHYFRTWRESGHLGRIMEELVAAGWETGPSANGATPSISKAGPLGAGDAQVNGAGPVKRVDADLTSAQRY